ncbi:nucleotide-diphospho-sugar transferase [Chytriomyces sp. MP71]|nr:nucleotide-diphospho-sugar transferase [Chytriomyces sp. MP71]
MKLDSARMRYKATGALLLLAGTTCAYLFFVSLLWEVGPQGEWPPALVREAAWPLETQSGALAPNLANTIPLLVHQTYKTRTVREWRRDRNKKQLIWFNSWRDRNPDAMHLVWTDAAADAFMRHAFNHTRFYEAYARLPRVVLKTDMLRYALIYQFGGVYADADTSCRRPIEEWFLGHNDATLIVGVEWYANFYSHMKDAEYRKLQLTQWTFAAAPKHPALFKALEDISNRVIDLYTPELLKDVKNVEFIGGPQVMTKHVREYMMGFDESFEDLTPQQKDGEGYFHKSRVLVHPMYSFYTQYSGRWFSRQTDLVDHHFYGASKYGWKFLE